MQGSPLTSTVLFHVGPVAVSKPLVTTWLIMATLAIGCRLVTRRLQMQPTRAQAVVEVAIRAAVAAKASPDLPPAIDRTVIMSREVIPLEPRWDQVRAAPEVVPAQKAAPRKK